MIVSDATAGVFFSGGLASTLSKDLSIVYIRHQHNVERSCHS